MSDSIYQVFVPAGVFQAVFDDDESPVEYRGDTLAIQYFKDWLLLNQVSGYQGIRINPENLTPEELYGFCQPTGSGNMIMPPFNDLIGFIADEQADKEELTLDNAGTTMPGLEYLRSLKRQPTFDSATGAEKLKLVKELRGVRQDLSTTKSGAEKLNLVKRVREIRAAIGIKPVEVENPQSAYDKGYALAKELGRMPVFIDDWIADTSDHEFIADFNAGAAAWLIENPQEVVDPLAAARVMIQSVEFKKIQKAFSSDLATVNAIDTGQMPGFNRSAFTNSITGKLTRLAPKDPLLVGCLLAWLFGVQKRFAKLPIANKNGVWNLVDFNQYLPLFNTETPVAVEKQAPKKVTVKSQFDVTPGWMAKLMGDGYRVLSGATRAFGGTNYLVSKGDINLSFDMRDKQSLPLDISGFNEDQLLIVSKLMEYGAIYADDALFVKTDEVAPVVVLEPDPVIETADRFSPGDIVYMSDITDENKRIAVNFRGYLDKEKSIVVWNGSQMPIETSRLFKDDLPQPEADPTISPDIIEPETQQATKLEAAKALEFLTAFIGRSQLSAITSAMRGEEKQFFFDKVVELQKQIQAMPKTYETDGQGDKAIAYLHYFKGSGDWYITEKDSEDEQLQAFGLSDLGYGGESGYISIVELIKMNVEIDLYWTPKSVGVIKGKDDEPEPIPPKGATPQAQFEAELTALQAETDITAYDARLDEIVGRIEEAGLMEAMDEKLNETADVLTGLMAEAEKGA